MVTRTSQIANAVEVVCRVGLIARLRACNHLWKFVHAGSGAEALALLDDADVVTLDEDLGCSPTDSRPWPRLQPRALRKRNGV